MISMDSKPSAAGLRKSAFSWITKLSLLASNLVPLSLILAILASRTWSPWFFVFAAFVVLGVCSTSWILAVSGTQSQAKRHVANVRDAGTEVAGYLATYLLPFFALPGSDWYVKSAYIVFGLVLVIVFLNSNLLAVSPLLYLFGRKLYSIEFDEEPGVSYFTVTRSQPKRGDLLSVSQWGSLLIRSKDS